ncbi:carnitinyl-CoA dehydratase, partial [Escherichia coli]|nr:carnitinyl-CoA dehydratase [Escherichia coli]
LPKNAIRCGKVVNVTMPDGASLIRPTAHAQP